MCLNVAYLYIHICCFFSKYTYTKLYMGNCMLKNIFIYIFARTKWYIFANMSAVLLISFTFYPYNTHSNFNLVHHHQSHNTSRNFIQSNEHRTTRSPPTTWFYHICTYVWQKLCHHVKKNVRCVQKLGRVTTL